MKPGSTRALLNPVRLLRPGLIGNIGANAYSRLIQIVIQLASVPILTGSWGIEKYGTWLLLFTIPSYLGMADLGLTSAAGNDMTISVARGNRGAALSMFQAVRLTVLAICATCFLAAIIALYVVAPDAIAFAQKATDGHARTVCLLLIAYGLVSLQSGTALAGFLATNGYTKSGYFNVTIVLAENALALLLVANGAGLLGAALAYLCVRLLGSCILSFWLYRHAPWLTSLKWSSSLQELRRLLGPAFAVMVLLGAEALSLQGMVLVVGAAAGVAAVPVFTTVRTLTRIGVQFTSIVNHASMPAFTVASAAGDSVRKARLVLIGMGTSLLVLMPAFVVLVTLGPFIVRVWTHGHIEPSFALVAVMAVAMLFNGIWKPISNLILAINAHAGFTYFFLSASVAVVILSYPMVRVMGAVGGGLGMAILDGVMILRVFSQAIRLDIFDWNLLRQMAIGLGTKTAHFCGLKSR